MLVFNVSTALTRQCRLIQAYVAQDDVLLGTLTVYETLYYSARLRFPDRMSWAETEQIVKSTISDVGLQESINTPIGNWHQRGLSGGEKRRVSIAVELLTRPRLLFLDEPTSGLDRYSHELSMCACLRALASAVVLFSTCALIVLGSDVQCLGISCGEYPSEPSSRWADGFVQYSST